MQVGSTNWTTVVKTFYIMMQNLLSIKLKEESINYLQANQSTIAANRLACERLLGFFTDIFAKFDFNVLCLMKTEFLAKNELPHWKNISPCSNCDEKHRPTLELLQKAQNV